MSDSFYATRPQPFDQAQGLRRLFDGRRQRFVAVASNPHVQFGSGLVDQLIAAFCVLHRRVLVVDAAESSPAAPELSWLDLAGCIEKLSPEIAYLPARGLPLRHVDTRGSAAGLLDALADAAPHVDVVLVHASASDLSRLFVRRPMRPVLMAADQPASVTHAYAALKLLALRTGCMSFDLMLAAPAHSPRRERIAQQIASCADGFLGAALHDWVAVDPVAEPLQPGVPMPVAPGLVRMCRQLLAIGDAEFDEAADKAAHSREHLQQVLSQSLHQGPQALFPAHAGLPLPGGAMSQS